MRVAAIGRTEVLYDTIELLISNGYDVPLIVTATEAPEYKRTENDFKLLAARIGAKYISTNNISALEHVDAIRESENIDIAVSINYVNVIEQRVIDSFKLGILNAHGGDLPKYRGNACQAWAIINGESKIGLCIHKMVGGELDSGDIISKDDIDIDINTKVTEVWNWMHLRIPSLFLESLKKLEQRPEYILEVQSTNKKDVLRCYPRMPEDGLINWKDDKITILRLINASNRPYSGAFTYFKGDLLKVWDAEIIDDSENYMAVPGQVCEVSKEDGYVIVATGSGKIKLNKVELNNLIDNPSTFIKSIRTRLGVKNIA